jgi:PAS domain S-box-containing protein
VKTASLLAKSLEDIDDGLIVLDQDWRCSYVNRVAAAFFKTTPEEIQNKVLWETLPYLQNSAFHRESLRAASEKTFVKVEDYHEPLGRWYEYRCHWTNNGMTVLLNDTTGHKKVEQVMLESRQAIEMAITGSSTGIWRIDLNPEKPGHMPDYLYLSPQLKAMIGFEGDEFPSSRSAWLDRVVPEDRARLEEAAQAHVDNRSEMYEVDYRIRHKDGSLRWFTRRGRLYRDEFNRPIRWAGADTDITDRELAAESVRQSEERLRQALEAGEVFTFEWRPAADEVVRSPNSASILGWTGDATRDSGESFFRRIHPEDRKAFMRLVSSLCPEQPGYETTYRYLRRDDEREVVLEESGRAVFDEAGKVVCVRGLTRDVTVRERMEQSLRQAYETLQAQTEELQSANEELQAQQEELQTQQEELHVQTKELREQEQALRASELLARNRLTEIEAIYDSARVGLCVFDLDLRYVRINERMAEINGIPASRHLGKTIREIVPDLADAGEKLAERVLRTGEPVLNVEFSGATAAQPGVLRYWIEHWLPLRDERNQVVAINIVAHEITERKRAEEALREANERLRTQAEELEERVAERTADLSKANAALRQAGAYNRSLIEASLDPLVTIGPDGRITDVNKATEEVTGCPRAELIGSDFSQYFIEPEKADEGYRRVFREGSVQDYPLEIRHKDGGVTSVLYNAAVYRDDAGEAIGVFAAARDVTELHQTQREMSAQRQRFNDVLEMLPAYLILLTPDHHVSYANRFFRERFGDSHGHRCFEYLFNRTEPCENCETYKVLASGQPHHWEWSGPDGRTYDIHDFPFTDVDGSPLIMEMGIDITERRQAEEALREANETLEQRVKERTTALEGANEQLQSQSEELQAINEELRAQTETLAAQTEELREANEQLRQHEQATLRAKELSDSLNRINEALHSTLEFSEVMQRLLAEGASVLNSDSAAVSLRQDGGWTVGHVHGIPASMVGARMADEEERHAALAVETRQPVAVSDVTNDDRVNRKHLKRHHIRAVLTVPLIARGEPLGVIFFNYHAVPHVFTEAETNFARQLASTAAIALENASLFGERREAELKIRRQTTILRGISRVFQEAMSARTEEDLGRVCLAVAEEITQSKFGFIGEIHGAGLQNIAISDPGWDACRMTDSTGHRRPQGNFTIHGVYGRVLKDGKSVVANDPANHPDSIGTPPGHPPLTAFLGVPLIREGETIGMIAMGNREGGYSQDEVEALESLAPAVVEAFLRKRAEQALTASEKKYRTLIETTNSIIVRWDRQGILQFVNERGADLLGYEPQELIGRHVSVLVPETESTGRDLSTLAQDILDHPEQYAYNPNENVRKDGTRVWIAWTNRAITDEDGVVQEVLAVGNDITELKQAEAAVNRNRKTLSELVERSPFGTYIVDSQFRIAMMNASSQEGAFRNVRPVIGRDFTEAMRILWPEPVAAEIIGLFRHTLETGEPYFSPRFINPRRDAETIESYEWELHRMTLPDGQFGVICYYFDSTKLREAEEALRESEERLRRVARAGRIGLFEWNATRDSAYWSPEHYELFGLEPGSSMKYERWLACVHPDDRERVTHNMTALLEEAGRGTATPPHMDEYRVVHGDGTVLWLETTVSMDSAGGDLILRGAVRDITERKQAEMALRESEQRLRMALEGGRMGLWEWDLEGGRTYWDRKVYELLGLEPGGQASHERFIERVDRRDIDLLDELIRKSMTDADDFQMEFRVIRRTGETGWMATSGKTIRNASGKPVRRLGILYDITPRKQMEEQLRRLNDQLEEEVQAQTEELRDMVDRLQDEVVRRVLAEGKLRKSSQMLEGFFQHTITPLAFMDRRFNFIRVNEAYARADGKSPEFFKGKNHFSLYPDGGNRAAFEEVVQTGRSYRAHARPFTYPDKPGQVVYWDLQLTPLQNDRGEVQYLVLNLRDVTGQQAALCELEQRARQLQKLTLELSQAEDRERRRMAEVLHDGLQQQLAAAKFHLGLLSSRTRSDAALQEIAGQLDRMLRDAIEQSRSLSHDLSPAVLYQSDLGESFEWLARQVQTKHGLTVHTEIHGRVDSQSESIKAFLFRTGQEILFNTVKHAKVQEARLRLQRRDEELWLTIADQGRGFDPHTLGRAAGFGLLSIRERVNLLGGRMKIRSVPDRGSVFLIVVPDAQIKEDRGQRTEDGGQKTENRADRRPVSSIPRPPVLRVLLVDDHKVMREGLAALIAEQKDMEIIGQAGDGREAVELTRLLEPDVVIMDVAMPVMAGDEATRRIKAELPQTRIIALSMFEEPGVREKMIGAGAETYLPKTGPSDGFLSAIRGLTE